MTKYELVKRLSGLLLKERGYANISFIKGDGSERKMKIVLGKDFIKSYFEARAKKLEAAGTPDIPVRATPETCINVIEEKEDGTQAWKRVRIDRLISVE